jgi:CheY-like chemotaxis protein
MDALRSAIERGDPYDVALVDLNMPAMDGLDLARAARADERISSVPLILLTSSGHRTTQQEARDVGVAGYLSKPVRQAQLYGTLATALGRAADDRPAPMVTAHTVREVRTRSRAHVLVAEDNPVNQKVAARMLERAGYRVDVAANGREAVDALTRIRYHIVLMDCQMPEMDGFEATAEIRRRETGHHIPIIAMTASATKADMERCFAAGMDDYISKPVNPDGLLRVLGRWTPLTTKERDGDAGPQVQDNGDGGDGILDEHTIATLKEFDSDENGDGTGNGFFAGIVDLFVNDTGSRVEELGRAVEGGDAPAVNRLAHAVKGSAANVGAVRVQELCARLEVDGAEDRLGDAPALFSRLQEEFTRATEALRART